MVLPDCEDGILSKNPIAQGSVASAISIASPPEFHYFIVAGDNYERVMKLIIELRDRRNVETYFRRSVNYWSNVAAEYSDDELASQSIVSCLACGC